MGIVLGIVRGIVQTKPFSCPGMASLICTEANELGIRWASVWVSVWALQMSDSAILVCDNSLNLMCVLMASGGIVFLFSSVSVYSGLGLQNKLRDVPLDNEKARVVYFSTRRALSELRLENRNF